MRRPLEFSLFFFSARAGSGAADGYRLLQRAAEVADRSGFAAIWTPERHFALFGGLYPNPAVTAAALSALTTRIGIRAGSVVLPLHDPLRVAEEWAVVDNLSGGRVGLSFATGWQVNDFVLAPELHGQRREVLERNLEIFRRLWRGESVTRTNALGQAVEIRTFPRPVQAEPPLWLTCQRDESFVRAGELGLNVLTNLNYQQLPDLERRIGRYREAIRRGHGRRGHLALMAHSYVAGTEADVEQVARPAMAEYLRENFQLQEANHFGLGAEAAFDLADDERAALLDRAVSRFISQAGLIGTESRCHETAARLYAMGVDEIACLIDFGVPLSETLASLDRISSIREALAA